MNKHNDDKDKATLWSVVHERSFVDTMGGLVVMNILYAVGIIGYLRQMSHGVSAILDRLIGANVAQSCFDGSYIAILLAWIISDNRRYRSAIRYLAARAGADAITGPDAITATPFRHAFSTRSLELGMVVLFGLFWVALMLRTATL